MFDHHNYTARDISYLIDRRVDIVILIILDKSILTCIAVVFNQVFEEWGMSMAGGGSQNNNNLS